MGKKLSDDLKRNYLVYLMLLPVILYYLIFCYAPMYGAIIAFKDYRPGLSILGSQWVGFKHFTQFFSSVYFSRLIKNTLAISIYTTLWGFPAPILLALMLNEVRSRYFKKTVQTLTYIPHFISMVVVCGMIANFSGTSGVFNDVIAFFGGERAPLLGKPELFRTIYIASGIWQSVGWGSIIYLAAISGIDQELYEAATIDGAGRLRKAINVTLPSIMPTILLLLILQIGGLLSVGYEKIILLVNDLTLVKADVISTYVYRKGLLDTNYSFSSAVGLFNSVINFILLVVANSLSRRFAQTGLW
ncbi:putative multiple-sugar transport system permease YteP [Clostridia bacterium]|nr:putative multiple-sugar transport system permease YteP [Clostridia bacterium]